MKHFCLYIFVYKTDSSREHSYKFIMITHFVFSSREHSEGRADPVQQQRHRAFHRRVLGVLRHDLSQGPVQELFLPGRLHKPDQSGSV